MPSQGGFLFPSGVRDPPTEGEILIQLRGIKKIYRAPDGGIVEALSGIDLDIGDGEIFGIIGL